MPNHRNKALGPNSLTLLGMPIRINGLEYPSSSTFIGRWGHPHRAYPDLVPVPQSVHQDFVSGKELAALPIDGGPWCD
jgi:hypothetical protein